MPTEAEEVAEDYRHALEDLSSNARFEISNLTVIARENTEHALLIAEVLEKHILKVSAQQPSIFIAKAPMRPSPSISPLQTEHFADQPLDGAE